MTAPVGERSTAAEWPGASQPLGSRPRRRSPRLPGRGDPSSGGPSAGGPSATGPQSAGRRSRRSRLSRKTWLGFGLLGVFLVLAAVGPALAPYNPSTGTGPTLAGPSLHHLLGTTQTDQDILSQLLVGTRVTLLIGFLAGAIATLLSVLVGVTAGYLGGWGDEGLSLFANLFLVIPALPLVIVLTSYLPNAGPVVIAVVISVTGWAWGAKLLRAQTLSIRRRDYVEAARIAGERTWRIVCFEILPNEIAIVASSFLFTVLFAILTQVALDFLGLVNVSGSWTWGTMLYWAQSDSALNVGAWWWFVPPGLCVALVGTGLALANFGLDELINPRLRTAGLSRKSDAKLARLGFTAVHRSQAVAEPVRASVAAAGGTFTPVHRPDAPVTSQAPAHAPDTAGPTATAPLNGSAR
jgi:peptide/nickel transport system permease protein